MKAQGDEHGNDARRHDSSPTYARLLAAAGAEFARGRSNPEKNKKVLSPGTEGSNAISIPDGGAKIPSSQTILRWTEGSQFSKAFLPAFWVAYKKRHPNIKVVYDNLPDLYLARVLQLAFQSTTGETPISG